MQNMKDITYVAAFPKSGITYLNFMLFHILFDRPQDARLIDSDYIFDVHESLARVPPPGDVPRYVKIHFSYSPHIPLRERAHRAVYLLRDPIDVMMSVWDFKHLTGEDGLLDASPADREALFQRFCQHWVSTGGLIYPWAGSWKDNVASWLDQNDLPLLVVRYERLKAQPLEELKRLCFFGREVADQRIAAAIEAGKPDNIRKLKSEEVNKGVPGSSIVPDWLGVMLKVFVSWGACTADRPKKSSVQGDANTPTRFSAQSWSVACPRQIVTARKITSRWGSHERHLLHLFRPQLFESCVLMIESLRRFEPNAPIYVLTLSDLCKTILASWLCLMSRSSRSRSWNRRIRSSRR